MLKVTESGKGNCSISIDTTKAYRKRAESIIIALSYNCRKMSREQDEEKCGSFQGA